MLHESEEGRNLTRHAAWHEGLLRRATIAIAFCALLSPVTASADTWIGRWASPACSADATAITFTKSTLDLSTFDMSCKILKVRQRSKLHEFQLACTGDGATFKTSMTVQVAKNRLEFVKQQPGAEFDPKSFVRCKG